MWNVGNMVDVRAEAEACFKSDCFSSGFQRMKYKKKSVNAL